MSLSVRVACVEQIFHRALALLHKAHRHAVASRKRFTVAIQKARISVQPNSLAAVLRRNQCIACHKKASRGASLRKILKAVFIHNRFLTHYHTVPEALRRFIDFINYCAALFIGEIFGIYGVLIFVYNILQHCKRRMRIAPCFRSLGFGKAFFRFCRSRFNIRVQNRCNAQVVNAQIARVSLVCKIYAAEVVNICRCCVHRNRLAQHGSVVNINLSYFLIVKIKRYFHAVPFVCRKAAELSVRVRAAVIHCKHQTVIHNPHKVGTGCLSRIPQHEKSARNLCRLHKAHRNIHAALA